MPKHLRKEVLEVTISTKLNGDERKMPCTLIASFLPPAKKDDPMTQKRRSSQRSFGQGSDAT